MPTLMIDLPEETYWEAIALPRDERQRIARDALRIAFVLTKQLQTIGEAVREDLLTAVEAVRFERMLARMYPSDSMYPSDRRIGTPWESQSSDIAR